MNVLTHKSVCITFCLLIPVQIRFHLVFPIQIIFKMKLFLLLNAKIVNLKYLII